MSEDPKHIDGQRMRGYIPPSDAFATEHTTQLLRCLAASTYPSDADISPPEDFEAVLKGIRSELTPWRFDLYFQLRKPVNRIETAIADEFQKEIRFDPETQKFSFNLTRLKGQNSSWHHLTEDELIDSVDFEMLNEGFEIIDSRVKHYGLVHAAIIARASWHHSIVQATFKENGISTGDIGSLAASAIAQLRAEPTSLWDAEWHAIDLMASRFRVQKDVPYPQVGNSSFRSEFAAIRETFGLLSVAWDVSKAVEKNQTAISKWFKRLFQGETFHPILVEQCSAFPSGKELQGRLRSEYDWLRTALKWEMDRRVATGIRAHEEHDSADDQASGNQDQVCSNTSFETFISKFNLNSRQRQIVEILWCADHRLTTNQVVQMLEKKCGPTSLGMTKQALAELVDRRILDNRQDVSPKGYAVCGKQ